MVPHAIGYLCCVARSRFVSSLRRLYARPAQGEIDFDLLLNESSADADPRPIVQILLNNAVVTDYACIDGVVAVDSSAQSSPQLEVQMNRTTHAARRIVHRAWPTPRHSGRVIASKRQTRPSGCWDRLKLTNAI